MPSPDFSKKLTSIISNIDISENIRFDIICRLLCETLKVHSVAMLTYRAKIDKLKCIGFYLTENDNVNHGNEMTEIINFMPYLEFFDSLFGNEIEEITIEDFCESVYYLKSSHENLISEKEFQKLKSSWLALYQNKFHRYKTKIHEEEHYVSADSISGGYFSSLLNSTVKMQDVPEVMKMTEGPQKGKAFYKALTELGLNIDVENLYYIALPLYTNQKYIGLLRLTAYLTNDENEMNIFLQSPKRHQKIVERFNNFSQLIALNLKANFYLDGFRKINNLIIDKNNNSKFEKDEINDVADSIADIINCNGCLIRFSDNSDSNALPIKGHSKTLIPYNKYMAKREDLKFSDDIMKIFATEKHESSPILAINFSVTKQSIFNFNTKEYYYNKEGNLKYKQVFDKRSFGDFDKEYVNDIVDFKMEEIVVIKIDKIENDAYLVLTNTKNKKFTITDIEIILLAAKKIGQEIKHFLDIQKISEVEKHASLLTSMRIVVHQVGARLSASASNVENFAKGRLFPYNWDIIKEKGNTVYTISEYEVSTIKKRASEIGRTLRQAMRQIERSSRIYELFEKPIDPKINPIDDLYHYLLNKCKDFNSLASRQKDIRIWLSKKEDLGTKMNTDIDLLNEVIDNILDNAIKYCYHREELIKHGINYIEGNVNSPGNIMVSYWNSFDNLKIQITNWGKPISSADKKIIFDIFKRGSNSDNILGSGIGLFLVKKIVESLNGNIEVISANNETIFTILLKK